VYVRGVFSRGFGERKRVDNRPGEFDRRRERRGVSVGR
jgi:hypothetical protein